MTEDMSWSNIVEPAESGPKTDRVKVLSAAETRREKSDPLATFHAHPIEGVGDGGRFSPHSRHPLWLLLLAVNVARVTLLRADTAVDANLQFVEYQYLRYAVSSNQTDIDIPCVFLYQDYYSGGAYAVDFPTLHLVSFDGNDPDAARGTSSLRITWDGMHWGQLELVCGGPRTNACGMARTVRFLAKGDVTNRQVRVGIWAKGNTPTEITNAWFTLGTNWSDYWMDLGVNALPPENLQSLVFWMDWATNDIYRTIRLDEVRVNTDSFDPLRVIQSYQPLWAPANSPPNTAAWRDANIYPWFCSLYDTALAIQNLLVCGRASDFVIAQNMADALFATESHSITGYCNVRYSGHTLLKDGRPRTSCDTTERGLGDNSWFGLALLDLHNVTGCQRYLGRALGISDWAEANLKCTNSAWGGYCWAADMAGRSTENNLDLFQLNRRLAAIAAARGDPSASNYAARANHAATFVLAMYNTNGGWFWTGADTNDVINTNTIPLDVQLWPYLTLGQCSEYTNRVDFLRPIRWAETNLIRRDTASCVSNVTFTGFTYSSESGSNVWFEGCASAAVVYGLLGDTNRAREMLALLELARTNGCNHDEHGEGQIAASSDRLHDPHFGGTYYDARLAVAPTAWTCFARTGINPFALPTLAFAVVGGNTQTVCRPFRLAVTAQNPCGAFTNVAIYFSNSLVASASSPPLETACEIDFPGAYVFTACVQDNSGTVKWATQAVTTITCPPHVLIAGRFRTNGDFKICMSGEVGRDYQILANSNLSTTNWNGLGVMEFTNGIWRFFDTDATNNVRRLYRAKQLP